MILGNRALFVLMVCVSAVLGGCGGGGGGGGGNPPTAAPTATPTTIATATPTPKNATPTPVVTFSPTPQPAGTVLNVSARPLTAGDTFAYTGSLTDNFEYFGQSPDPTSSGAGATPIPNSNTNYTVTQTVTNEGTTSFDSATPYDLQTVETDAGPNQSTTITTDTYLLNGALGTSTGFYTYGFTSIDSLGQKITETLQGVPGTSTPNGLLDVLPETQNAHWTNTGANTMAESEADGFTANRVTAANGTYVENDAYPDPSNYTPAPAPFTATITENSDGSGQYSFPLNGATPNSLFNVSAPDSSGTITVELEAGGDPTNSLTYLVSNWYAGLPLYSEYDHQDGELAYPAGCHVPAAFGTTGNAVEQKFTKVDAVLGTLENFDQLTYVNGGYAVCTTLKDVTDVFYDLSGQGQSDAGIDINGAGDPAEVATITSTIGLTSTSVTPQFRRSDTSKTLDVSNSARVASVRTNFLAVVERNRLERIHRTAKHLRTMHFVSKHR